MASLAPWSWHVYPNSWKTKAVVSQLVHEHHDPPWRAGRKTKERLLEKCPPSHRGTPSRLKLSWFLGEEKKRWFNNKKQNWNNTLLIQIKKIALSQASLWRIRIIWECEPENVNWKDVWRNGKSVSLLMLLLADYFFFFFFLRLKTKCGPLWKSLLDLFQCCFCFMLAEACGILALPPGIQPAPPGLEGKVFPWTAREVPENSLI